MPIRIGNHNELCALKYGDRADGWLKDGFQVEARIDSCMAMYPILSTVYRVFFNKYTSSMGQ